MASEQLHAKPLQWRIASGGRTARLSGGWSALGEDRTEVPLDELAGLLGADAASALSLRLSAQLSSPGSWVFYARRLKERTEAFADVLVKASQTTAGAEGTVLDLTNRLVGLGPRIPGDMDRMVAFSQRLTQDLRIPLRQIHDCLGFIRTSQNDPAEVAKWVLFAETCLSRARAVVGDAHELLQVVGGKKPVHFEALKLSTVLPALSRLHLPAARAAGKTLEADVRDDVAALVDFRALTAVMDNLLSNAIRHSGDGTLVQVRGGRDEAGLPLIVVADEGKSLSDEQFGQLFEPFYRANSNAPGSGLGLILVLELCRMMGASVLLRKNSRGGLTAEVRLQPADEGLTAL